MSKLLDFDRQTGITETFHKDEMTGKFAIKKTQDVDAIFKANMEEQNAIGNNTWKGDMHKVASIPLVIWEQWSNELKEQGKHQDPGHNSNRAFLIAKLNNRDFLKLRTKQGRI